MPMEGQWARSNAPLRTLEPRERAVGVALGAITLLAIAVIVALNIGKGPAPLPAGCFTATVPWVMGGEQFNACGERAENLCAKSIEERTAFQRGVMEGCREAGLAG
jgi:hypothetical protein